MTEITRRDLLRLGLGAAGLTLVPNLALAAPAQARPARPGALATGFPDLDDLLGGGLPCSGLTVLGSRPSMGKTSLAMGITLNIVRRPGPGSVAYFSLESTREDLLQRAICAVARVRVCDLRRGCLSQEDWQRLTQAMNSLAAAPLYFYDRPGLTVAEMRGEACRLRQRNGLDFIIVDYLQLVPGEASRGCHARLAEYWEICEKDRFEAVFEIGLQLQELARELEVPVLLLGQVRREVEERDDNRPHLDDLRNSAALEPHADACLTLFRSEYYEPDLDPGVAEVILSKHSAGRLGTARLGFEARYQRFHSLTS